MQNIQKNTPLANNHISVYCVVIGFDGEQLKVLLVKRAGEDVYKRQAKNYEGATIKEAYVADKESGKVYKVILTTKDSQEVTCLLYTSRCV